MSLYDQASGMALPVLPLCRQWCRPGDILYTVQYIAYIILYSSVWCVSNYIKVLALFGTVVSCLAGLFSCWKCLRVYPFIFAHLVACEHIIQFQRLETEPRSVLQGQGFTVLITCLWIILLYPTVEIINSIFTSKSTLLRVNIFLKWHVV